MDLLTADGKKEGIETAETQIGSLNAGDIVKFNGDYIFTDDVMILSDGEGVGSGESAGYGAVKSYNNSSRLVTFYNSDLTSSKIVNDTAVIYVDMSNPSASKWEGYMTGSVVQAEEISANVYAANVFAYANNGDSEFALLVVEINNELKDDDGNVQEVNDNTRVNRVDREEVEFDANTAGLLNKDIAIKLTAIDGAILENIKYGEDDSLLTSTTDYYFEEESGQVVLRKRGLAKMNASGGATKVTFLMSKGENPELTVKFVNSYNVDFQVIDDSNIVVKGAEITIYQDNDKVITLGTDQNGKATIALKKGSYTYSVAGKNSTPVTGTLNINSDNIQKTVSIMARRYAISVNVLTASSDKVSDAEVTLNGKTIITGESGVVEFMVPTGSYKLIVNKNGYKTITKDLIATEDQRICIVLDDDKI